MALVRPQDLMVSFEEDGAILIRSVSRGKGARAPAFAVGVLSLCTEPKERQDIVLQMGPQGGVLYDGLAAAGLLVPEEQADESPVLFANFSNIAIHRRMLDDEPRINAYRDAIQAVVKEGDVVADAGSGSGVLAVLAALAGARKVYAIEQTDFARVIPQIARDSGVADRVEVIQANMKSVQLPERVDVLVTETFGHFALAEGTMPAVSTFAERNLARGGNVIPSEVSLHLAPMSEAPRILLGPFRKRHDGVDLSSLLLDASSRSHGDVVTPQQIGPATCVGRVRMPNDATFEGTLVLEEPCEALAGWFTLHMAPGIDLLTGPHDPPTHWKQTVLPFSLNPGEYVVRTFPAPEDSVTLVVEIGGHEVRIR